MAFHLGRLMALASIALLPLLGCSLGPAALKGNRYQYNLSVQKSNSEELLVNLVRAKYLEPLFFLQVGAISSSFNYEMAVGAEATFFDKDKAPTGPFWMGRTTAGIAERPTISYMPVQGEMVAKHFLEEISIERFLLLTRAGWSIEALIWVMVNRMGDLENFNPSDAGGQNYSGFLRAARILRRIQERGDMEIGTLGKEGKGLVQMRFVDSQEANELEDLLGVRPERVSSPNGRPIYAITLTTVRDLAAGAKRERGYAEVPLKLKSYFEVLYDLAWSVDCPDDDIDGGVVLKPSPLSDDLASRSGPHAGLLRVQFSNMHPGPAYVSVPYRGLWFYISDGDTRSKLFFRLLGYLFSLQAGEIQPVQPLLTLPVR